MIWTLLAFILWMMIGFGCIALLNLFYRKVMHVNPEHSFQVGIFTFASCVGLIWLIYIMQTTDIRLPIFK